MSPAGLLAAHISNKYVNLAPLLQKLAGAFGQESLVVESRGDASQDLYSATWVLIGRSLAGFLDIGPPVPPWQAQSEPGPRLWTDDYVNLLAVLR